MISFIDKYLTIAAGLVAVSLMGVVSYQSHKIDRLSLKLTYAQEQLKILQELNSRLELTLEQEKSAVERQADLVNQYRAQANTKQESIRYVLKENQCANTAMPDAVIKQLQ